MIRRYYDKVEKKRAFDIIKAMIEDDEMEQVNHSGLDPLFTDDQLWALEIARDILSPDYYNKIPADFESEP
jgi:hypothetical protein